MGINEKTPSKSEYFSWINNTNEGSTEANTLANLNFFKYLKDNYSMKLDIYALDAGNLDSPGNYYGTLDDIRILKNFPHSYSYISKKAKEIGTKIGIWCGADGFGNTTKDAKKRHNLLVSLCRDYDFGLFKFDTVCGELRKDKREYFKDALTECRKYQDELVVLNHRNDLGEYSYLQTTFLWEGLESYTDVHCYNKICAPHNRAYIFNRGYTPSLKRLTEDHGVCISSSIDYFEDDLIYQAFNRCLILAPEIYGNPWLMRDDELPIMAHIFNLHRYYRNILVDSMIPSNLYLGDTPIIRGSKTKRFLSTGNASWDIKEISFPLNDRIGLYTNEKVAVISRFPYEEFLGIYDYNDAIKVNLLPFRAALIEITALSELKPVIMNAKYQIIKEDENLNILKVKILKSDGELYLFKDGNKQLVQCDQVDDIEKNPLFIAKMDEKEYSGNKEKLYEQIHFTLDNDSLELRSLKRSGKSNIIEVNICRDFFFNQDSYKKRGLDSNIPFDNNPNTIYDTKSVSYSNHDGRIGFRVDGGTLRIDLLKEYDIDQLKITYFDECGKHPLMFKKQVIKDNLETSKDLSIWQKSELLSVNNIGETKERVFAYYSDQEIDVYGNRMEASFNLSGNSIRYIRMPEQVDRIYTIKFYKNNKEIDVKTPHLNNLFAPYYKRKTKFYMEKEIILESSYRYPEIVIAVNGYTGYENVSCGIIVNNKVIGAPRRAPEYPTNAFEYPVHPVDSNYTFFIPIEKEWMNKKAKLVLLLGDDDKLTSPPNVNIYIKDSHKERNGRIICCFSPCIQ